MDKDFEIEYIKASIQNMNEQKRYTLIFLSFDIVVLAFLIDKVVLNGALPLDCLYRWWLILTILMYFTSAGLFLLWLGKIHVLSQELIDLFITRDISSVREIHSPGKTFWKEHGWIYKTAYTFLISGVLSSIIILLWIYL